MSEYTEKRDRPKKRKYEDIEKLVLKYKDVVVIGNGKICSKSDEIWEIMSKELSLKNQCIPKSSLYSYVMCDTHGIRKIINPNFFKRAIINNPEVKKAVEHPPKTDFSMNSINSVDDIPSKTVEVFLSKREFDDILVRKQYNNKRGDKNVLKKLEREYAVLERGKWQLLITK